MGCLMDFSEAYKTMAWYDMETQEKLQSTLLEETFQRNDDKNYKK